MSMGKQLPPAKRGQNRLQHSSKVEHVTPIARDQTPEEKAASAAQVQEGYERAGLETPMKREAYHQAIQAHVPRMIEWYDTQIMAGRLQGHGDIGGAIKTGAGEGHSEIYQRPEPEAHG